MVMDQAQGLFTLSPQPWGTNSSTVHFHKGKTQIPNTPRNKYNIFTGGWVTDRGGDQKRQTERQKDRQTDRTTNRNLTRTRRTSCIFAISSSFFLISACRLRSRSRVLWTMAWASMSFTCFLCSLRLMFSLYVDSDTISPRLETYNNSVAAAVTCIQNFENAISLKEDTFSLSLICRMTSDDNETQEVSETLSACP